VSGRSPWALRVVVVSRDAMLAEALDALVEAPGGVSRLDWHAEDLRDALRRADALVVDLPPRLHRQTLAVVGGRFPGRTVVLLQDGEREEALPPGPWTVRYRPVQIAELWAAVAGDAVPSAAPAAGGPVPASQPPPGPKPMIGMSGRELEPVIGPGQVAPGMDARTLERLRRWQARSQGAPAAEPEAAPAERPDAGGATAAAARRGGPGRRTGPLPGD